MGIFSDVQLIYTEGIRGFRSKTSRETNRLLLGCDPVLYLGALGILAGLAETAIRSLNALLSSPVYTPSSSAMELGAYVLWWILALPLVNALIAYLIALRMRPGIPKALESDAANTFGSVGAQLLFFEAVSIAVTYLGSFVYWYLGAVDYLLRGGDLGYHGSPLLYSLHGVFGVSYAGWGDQPGILDTQAQRSIGSVVLNEAVTHACYWILKYAYLVQLSACLLFHRSPRVIRESLSMLMTTCFFTSSAALVVSLKWSRTWHDDPPRLDYYHLSVFLFSIIVLLFTLRVFRRSFTSSADSVPASNP